LGLVFELDADRSDWRRASPRRLAPARLVPSFVVAVAIAVGARLSTSVLPPVASEVTIAILIGLLVGRVAAIRSAPLRPGFGFSSARSGRGRS
jgi:uncharacterized membrane protein YadS